MWSQVRFRYGKMYKSPCHSQLDCRFKSHEYNRMTCSTWAHSFLGICKMPQIKTQEGYKKQFIWEVKNVTPHIPIAKIPQSSKESKDLWFVLPSLCRIGLWSCTWHKSGEKNSKQTHNWEGRLPATKVHTLSGGPEKTSGLFYARGTNRNPDPPGDSLEAHTLAGPEWD